VIAKPFAHQLISIKHNDKSKIVFDLSDPGTGKTFVRIVGFAKRRKKGGGCLLVMAPRTLLRTVWLNDIKKFAPHLKVAVCNAANRENAFAEDADVYVTNLDASKWLAMQKTAFFKKFSELAVDESTAYKHHTSQRSKAMARVARHFEYRCCMTGTPTSNSITDVWHQALILDEGKRLGNSFYKFRDAVCVPTQVGREAQMVKWSDKEGAEEAVFGLLSDIVVRHKFEDCVDIPANHSYSVPFDLTSKQLKTYLEMEQTQMLQLGKNAITAVHAASVRTKLLQIASGAVYDGLGSFQVVDHARYELVLDLVEQRKQSLVFFLWKHQRDMMVEEAEKRGLTFCVLDGATSDRDRDEMVQSYQAGVYQVMFAHPKSAAHGLTLTKGTATIWSSPTDDLEIYKQGSKRQHRMGQTQKTETIVVIAKGTFDEKVWDNMLSKGKRMDNLLDLFGTLVKPAAPVADRKKKVVETA
jgi:SNF2 family DNA or RNA helicase